MPRRQQFGPYSREERGRGTLLIGAGIAALLVAGLVAIVVTPFLGDDERLLVLSRDATTQVEEGQRVQVTGTVRAFDRESAAQRELNDIDADEPNALIADRVRRVGDAVPTTPGRLVDVRESDGLVGQRVTIVGDVEEVLSRGVFVLSED